MTKEELEVLKDVSGFDEYAYDKLMKRLTSPEEYDWRLLAVTEICHTAIVCTVIVCIAAWVLK